MENNNEGLYNRYSEDNEKGKQITINLNAILWDDQKDVSQQAVWDLANALLRPYRSFGTGSGTKHSFHLEIEVHKNKSYGISMFGDNIKV